MSGFAPAGIPLDVGKFEELASGMAPAERALDRPQIWSAAMKVVVALAGAGLQNALLPRRDAGSKTTGAVV